MRRAPIPSPACRVLPALALAAACGGSDTTVNQLYPDIAVAPESVDFGDVVVLYDATQTIQLVNAGRATLEVSSIAVEGNDDAVFNVYPDSVELAPDDSMGVDIGFAPATYLLYERDLVVKSNDPDTPELRVPLRGEGVDGPVPDISLSTNSLDFGTVPVGSTEVLYFTITNVGDGDLTIGDTTQSGSGAFQVTTWPDGQTLAGEGGMFTVIVEYAPTSDAGDNGSLTIQSNDPDEPEVEVLFVGNGGGSFDYPVADIDCPGTVDPPDTIDLDGTGSYDPNGYEPLTYQWSLVSSPEGSSAEIDDEAADFTSMFVDLAGTYEVQLQVTNSMGLTSSPARCEFEAEPSESLHVEMFWNTGDTDFDLHLVQDGYDFLEKPGDCCWCNPNPNWGESGSGDDPELALDNRAGYGPENIRLDTPADGNYFVKVHYFEDRGGGTTTATVRIWIDGVLEDETSQVFDHQNRVWDVGYVKWPEGVFVEQENDLYKPDTKECF